MSEGLSLPVEKALIEEGGIEIEEEMGVSVTVSSEKESLVLYSKETLVAVDSEITGFRFLCNVPGCGKSFKRRSVQNEHLAVHAGHRGFKCDECDQTFFTSNQKYKHKESSHGVNKCSICDKHFSKKSNLFYHIEKQHKNKVTDFPCILCSSTFSQKSDLTKHMKTHSDSEAFNCSICGKSFAYKNSLRRHEKIHLDEKFHSCDNCDQKFIQKCDLSKHMETHGNSRFKCKVCNQVYSRKDSLMRHSRLHRLSLSCPVESCWDRFPSKHSLMAHLRTDHNRLEVEPVMTSLTFLDRPEEEDPEIVDNPEPVEGSSLDQASFIQSSQDMLINRSSDNILLDIDTMALENAGIFVDKTCLFNLKDDMDVDLSTGESLVNESVLQSIQRERELEEHKFVIAE